MSLPRVIMKFGGTSLQDEPAIRRAADLVARAQATRPVAVVVSAAARVTDALEELLKVAEARGPVEQRVATLRQRHVQLGEALGLDLEPLRGHLDDLQGLARGVALLAEVTPRTRDLVLSFGEILMAEIFAAHLKSRGLNSRAWVAGQLGLVTDDRFNRARPLVEAFARIAGSLSREAPHIPVVTGFVGETLEGDRTTLGRGGSDYTASILGKALAVEEVQIWTDVPGILTADPRLISAARLVPRLTFEEAAELAYSGAKVLHPSTITPAMEGVIPVRVLDTQLDDQPGTTIVGEAQVGDPPRVQSIAHKIGISVVTVTSPRMLARHGFLSRIAAVFDRHQASIDMISTSEVSVSMTTDDPITEQSPLLEELSEFADVECRRGRGMISVVGRGLSQQSDLVGQTFQRVADAGLSVEMISYGTACTNLSFLVPEQQVLQGLRALHAYYFESTS